MDSMRKRETSLTYRESNRVFVVVQAVALVSILTEPLRFPRMNMYGLCVNSEGPEGHAVSELSNLCPGLPRHDTRSPPLTKVPSD